MQKTVLEMLKTWYFSYSAFWSAGQWGGYSPLCPTPLATLLQTQVFSKKKVLKFFFRRSQKKGLQKFFSGVKGLQKNFFFRQSLLEESKKKAFADFPQGFWRFPTKFQRFKNSAVLEPRTGQFSRTCGFETKAKDFKMCPRGQERLRGPHLWFGIVFFCFFCYQKVKVICNQY